MEIAIISAKKAGRPAADLHLDASGLPNPHEVPGLRPRDGQNRLVIEWLFSHPESETFIAESVNTIIDREPARVVVTCSAGKRRSVAIADRIADELADHGIDATVTHRELEKEKKRKLRGTTERGYGHAHQTRRESLMYRHKDGTPCDWCGRPMFVNKEKNFDGAALEADHPDADKAKLAKRLLHKRCNGQKSNRNLMHGPGWYDRNGRSAADLHHPAGTLTKW